jgi:hypothetical protein
VTTRRYALRYAISHLVAAGDCQAIYSRASNLDFLEAKCNELGIDDVEFDIRRAAGACLAAGDMAHHGTLDRLVRSIAGESSPLSRAAGTDTSRLWSRVRQSNRASSRIEQVVPSAPGGGAPPVARSAPSQSPALSGALIGRLGAVTPARVPATSTVQRTQLGPRPMSLCGHPALLSKLVCRGGAVTACAVTPDSRCVIAAYSDHSLKAWDIESGRLLRTMNGHRGVVESCAVTPDGQRVVSASADATLKVWDLKLGALLATLEGHAGSVESCAVSPDGRWVVSASADTTLKIWDLKFGILLATFEGHTGSVESCAVTPDGCKVVSGSADTTLKVWDLQTGSELATFNGHVESVESCAVTPDGRRVVSGSCDHTLKVWDIDTGTATTLKGHHGPVSCVCVTDSRSVYSASVDTTLGIWDMDTGHRVTAFEGHVGPVTCCVVTPDGRRLISGSPDDTLKVWSLDGAPTSTLPGGVGALPRGVAQPTLANPSTVRRGRKPTGTKQLILFLAANPKDTNRRVLEEECAAIERELRSSRHGNDFEFRS